MKNKEKVFSNIQAKLKSLHFNIISEDRDRPWGGFFVIDENQAPQFAAHFFPEEDFESLKLSEKLSPKILMVAPYKRLSWQYHHRRAEIWRCIDGQVGVITSNTDVETDSIILKTQDKIKLSQGQRHRLIGLDEWGVVAEIWQHTDAHHPSNEEDIIRVQDDFQRR